MLIMNLIVGLAAIFIAQNPIQASSLPSPTGPTPVGRVSVQWVDSKRPDITGNGHRELMAHIWYPSAGSTAQYGAYMPTVNSIADKPVGAAFANLFGSAWTEIRSNTLKSHAFENAPLARTKHPLPLLVFSAGGGGTPLAYTTQMEELASHGYVVVGVEHTYDAPAVMFRDGRVVFYAAEMWAKFRSEAGNEEAFEKRVTDILAPDITSVIDKLRELDTDRASIFHSKLDTTRIGVFGHSRGGRIAARACQIDTRIKACMNEDGNWSWQPFWLDARGQSLQQPFMMLDHLDPELPDEAFAQMGTTREAYAQERAARQAEARQKLYGTVAGGAYHVTITTPGISHNSFSDIRLLGRADPPSINLWPKEVQAATPHAQILRRVGGLTTAFFDTYLRGSPSALAAVGGDEVRIERFGKATR